MDVRALEGKQAVAVAADGLGEPGLRVSSIRPGLTRTGQHLTVDGGHTLRRMSDMRPAARA